MSSESVVLCEGYHDRAFWAGWLIHLGCQVPSAPPPGGSRPRDVIDPWGQEVTGGPYGFRSMTNTFIRVAPCGGRDKIRVEARRRLTRRNVEPLRSLVLNVDSDNRADSVTPGTAGIKQQSLRDLLRRDLGLTVDETDAGDFVLDDGRTMVSLVRWETSDDVAAGLPNQQTLERLVCAAIVAAYPERAPAVQRWLEERPSAPPGGPKEYAWSYMAGWHAEDGCDFFYRRVWHDGRVGSELEQRLVCRLMNTPS